LRGDDVSDRVVVDARTFPPLWREREREGGRASRTRTGVEDLPRGGVVPDRGGHHRRDVLRVRDDAELIAAARDRDRPPSHDAVEEPLLAVFGSFRDDDATTTSGRSRKASEAELKGFAGGD
jgi:hypothetical protein